MQTRSGESGIYAKEFTDYKYSSAGFYYKDDKTWDFLTHYGDARFE